MTSVLYLLLLIKESSLCLQTYIENTSSKADEELRNSFEVQKYKTYQRKVAILSFKKAARTSPKYCNGSPILVVSLSCTVIVWFSLFIGLFQWAKIILACHNLNFCKMWHHTWQIVGNEYFRFLNLGSGSRKATLSYFTKVKSVDKYFYFFTDKL